MKQKQWPQIKAFFREHRYVFLIFLCSVFFALWSGSFSSPDKTTTESSQASIDTFIPGGYVLVPIQVSNLQSLDPMLGQNAVIDLFEADSTQRFSRRLGRNLRVIRAPNDPSQIAVLAPESEAPALVNVQSALYAVIRNPKSAGTKFEERPKVAHGPNIIYLNQ